MIRLRNLFMILSSVASFFVSAQSPEPLLTNVLNREIISLDGTWSYIIDPYHVGYEAWRYNFAEYQDPKSNFVEYAFSSSNTLKVPGDWNTQHDKLLFYEGLVWYQRTFGMSKIEDKRYVLYFAGANYKTEVFLNGVKVGSHEGGFTPFNFDVTDRLQKGENYLVVAVNNERKKEYVPTLKTDWWNYGGLTRSVKLLELSNVYIRDYRLQLKEDSQNILAGWVQLSEPVAQTVTVNIPELKISKRITTDSNGRAAFEIKSKPNLWTPENPRLYNVSFLCGEDEMQDEVGFRTIEVKGTEILLNGKPVFLKGVCMHEETPWNGGRVASADQAKQLLDWAKELNANFVRLAHYPHNEEIIRLADKMGIMLWSEIPVYWNIDFENEHSYTVAEQMLLEMISRDQNRASVIIWSVANETPQKEVRTKFLEKLINKTRDTDPTRLVSAALHQVVYDADTRTKTINDDLAQYVDILSVNFYCRWYEMFDFECGDLSWASELKKPLIMSEFGAGSLQGLRGGQDERWTEDFQAETYRQDIEMFDKIPFLAGTAPWILKDFRSPLRMLPGIQDYYNRKGLVSERGVRKQAFFVLQEYYKEK